MSVTEGSSIETIAPVGCARHLRSEQIGRVALVVNGDHPEIFPVNYVVDDAGDIFFRTDPGTKLDAVAEAPMIAFEIDGIDEPRELGWSVLVVGHAQRLDDPAEVARVRALLEPWAAGQKADVVRLRPEKVSGRRLSRPVTKRLRGAGERPS